MDNSSCSTCSAPKAKYGCKSCQVKLCKDCTQFVDDDRASFLDPKIAKDLAGVYCSYCYSGKIAPELDRYDELMEKAKNVFVYFKEQGKETRLIKRSEKPFKIDECGDRDETILRLAFFAAQAGYNCLVDVEVIYDKKRDGSYKIAKWSGTGTPTMVDPVRASRESKIKSPSRR